MPQLRLIQLPVAGLDQVDLAAVPAGVPVCNVFEHELGIAEYVLAAMLHLTVDLAGRDARFKAGSWAESPLQGAPTRRELAGQTVGCIGYGHIGRAVAVRARAFGMRVMALTASGRTGDPAPDWSGGPAELDRLLEAADFLLIACPLSDGDARPDRRAAARPHEAGRGADQRRPWRHRRRAGAVRGAARAPPRRCRARHLVPLPERRGAGRAPRQPAVPRARQRRS